jgi:membrane associated rhomboid family serine protease
MSVYDYVLLLITFVILFGSIIFLYEKFSSIIVFLLLYFASFYVAGLLGEILSEKKKWNTVDYIILTLTVLALAGAISAIIGAIVYFAGFKQYLMLTFWYLYNILLLVFFTTILSKLGGESCGRRKEKKKEDIRKRQLIKIY